MKRLVFILVLLAGCRGASLLDIAASTVQINGGCGTVIHVEDCLVADKVTILTAHHVVDGPVQPIIIAFKRDEWGFVTDAHVAVGEVKTADDSMDIAIVTCTMPTGFVRPVRVSREVPRFGDRLWSASYPGRTLVVTEGRFGGSTVKGSIYTGGTTWGSSGGGIYNSRLELVGVSQAMLSSKGLPFYNAGLWTPVIRGEIEVVLLES